MKFLFDFFPILLFFVAYKVYGIYAATIVAIVASVMQVGYIWFTQRRVENMHLITLAMVVVFGGATLLLQDELFIKWKPTVVNWLFALVLLGSQFYGEKTIIERLMGATVTLPNPLWTRLNLSWTGFFVFLGVINLYVVYNYDTDTWVNFKLFGMMGLTLAFVLVQGVFLMKYMDQAPPNSKD